MARIPFVGRMKIREYIGLLVSFLLLAFERIIRIITLAIGGKPRGTLDFVDLCARYGYACEEHVVQTTDGYLLGLHRLAWKRGEEDSRVNSGPGSIEKRVVYLHHGLLMNSEVWVCLTDKERCLPFQLVDRGYDVWLGNNRGNKYSKKSIRRPATSTAFWDFSIDEFAFHDIPDSIAYVLQSTSQPSLSYIGFSQGTAQAFAGLSIHPKLNEQVDLFIALAPAMSPAGLSNSVVDALVKASPEVLYLAFGRKSILASATMWQAILPPWIFVRIIDISLGFLFGWKAKNITPSQKLAAYSHLYSFTSTKSVVHWFQIIRNQSFQMFDDEASSLWNFGAATSRSYKVARFPTKNIKTPVKLIYGGSDGLVDIRVMKKQLPEGTMAIEIPEYEHLDFLWAEDVDKMVFPHVFEALDDAHRVKEEQRHESDEEEDHHHHEFEEDEEDHRDADGDVDDDLHRKDDADSEPHHESDDVEDDHRHESDDFKDDEYHHQDDDAAEADLPPSSDSSPPTAAIDGAMEVDEEKEKKNGEVVVVVEEVMMTTDDEVEVEEVASVISTMEVAAPIAIMTTTASSSATSMTETLDSTVSISTEDVVSVTTSTTPSPTSTTSTTEIPASPIISATEIPPPSTISSTATLTPPVAMMTKNSTKKNKMVVKVKEPYWKKIKNSRKNVEGRKKIPMAMPREALSAWIRRG
ncbi:MAG: hypothetical protein M1823_004148 [Watsoniomyces obsoletus]|nr:MAG: hypothetical protein M1823_004148 [Watsoniomyces obsoletus]